MNVHEPLCGHGGRGAVPEQLACAGPVHAIDPMHEPYVELGRVVQKLDQQRVLRGARSSALGEDAGRRAVVVASVRDRPDALDDRDQIGSRQRLASGSRRSARS
ncbi:MAG: hypothetical protein ACRDKJ_05020 [Actinomycetota bacterium]